MTGLRWGVAAAGLAAAGALMYLVFKAQAWGRAPIYAAPQGRPVRGIAYALGRGLLPWEKESARLHLAAYMAGIGYHIAIFAGFAALAVRVIGLTLPPPLELFLRSVIGLGLACGLGLLAKRLLTEILRRLSRPDDFGANILVDLFLAAAIAASWRPPFVPVFFCAGIALLLYMPVGKLRHSLFFFLSRARFGAFFGRRGTLPPPRHELRV